MRPAVARRGTIHLTLDPSLDNVVLVHGTVPTNAETTSPSRPNPVPSIKTSFSPYVGPSVGDTDFANPTSESEEASGAIHVKVVG